LQFWHIGHYLRFLRHVGLADERNAHLRFEIGGGGTCVPQKRATTT
jgi:hypothetical protein